MKNLEVKELVVQLLDKDPSNRISSLDQIKTFPLFKNFKWEDMLSLSAMPPNLPKRFELPKHDTLTMPFLKYLAFYAKEKNVSLKKVCFTTKEIDKFQEWYDEF